MGARDQRRQHAVRPPRGRARIIVGATLLAGAVVVGLPGAPAGAVGEPEITGVVFQDFDSDGSYDSTFVSEGVAVDVPIAGIDVRAFDKSGDQVGSAVTAADGTYTLAVSLAAVTNDVRVEFSVPASGPLAAMHPSFIGPDSGGLVQFVTAPATNVSLGLNVPTEYCQSNPNLAYTRLCSGVSIDSPTSLVTRFDGGPFTSYFDGSVLITDVYTSWSSNGTADRTDTGSILGTTWDPRSGRIINAAYVRRHASMYEFGGRARPGALFSTVPGGTDAAAGTGGSTSFLVDLETLLPGDQFSNSSAAGPGYIPNNLERGLAHFVDGTGDGGGDGEGMDSDLVEGFDGVYEEVGAAGIGDIETDGRGRLWVVSLYNGQLYQVNLPSDGSAPTTMVSLGTVGADVVCMNGAKRPFSVKYWRGSLYLGVVCDGSLDYDPFNPGTVADTNLTFTVMSYDLTTNSWSTFFGPRYLDAGANVQRGAASDTTAAIPTARVWNPWTELFPTNPSEQYLFDARPVPMLSEIEFDRDGSMILGFRDRTGDQNGAPGTENPGGYATTDAVAAAGDVYRVCRVGAGFAPTDYAFEGSDALCPQVTNAYTLGSETSINTEYYSAENWVSQNLETSVGMIEQVPGFSSVIVNTVNPVQVLAPELANGAGSQMFSNLTGLNTASVSASGVAFSASSLFGQPNTGGEFWESNGMGDVEALCDRAPLQIGSRVWVDDDKDGIQDPTESTVVGVTVRLYNSSDELVGTALTDGDGQFYFVSNIDEPISGDGDRIGGGLVPDDDFTIRFDNPDDYLAVSGALYPFQPTQLRATSANPDDLDTEIDSDAELAGTGNYGVDDFPYIVVPPLAPGENSLGLDAGFTWPVSSIGDYVWIDLDHDGTQDAAEPGAENITVTLHGWDSVAGATTTAVDLNGDPVMPTVTDADGYYVFDNLVAGEYVVEFTAPAYYLYATKDAGWADQTTDSDADQVTGFTAPFTLANEASGDTVIDTDPTTLALFTNSSIDAGLVLPYVGVASRAWQDYDTDGVQDPLEPGLPGVVVELLDSDGNPAKDHFGFPVPATSTDGSGFYSFTVLRPDSYRVRFTLPDGYVFAPFEVTTFDLDSDGNPLNGLSSVFEVSDEVNGSTTVADLYGLPDADLVNDTIDVGGIPPIVGVGDRAWQDLDSDGVQDQGEPPLAGVSVRLFEADGSTSATDASGGSVAAAVTGADGSYFFDNLYPRDYVVEFSLPTGYAFTTAFNGSVGVDSNADVVTGKSGVFTVLAAPAGTSVTDVDPGTDAVVVNPSIDAGYVPPLVSIGDEAWQDLDEDGVQDAGEPALAGVLVELFDGDGAPARLPDGTLVDAVYTDPTGTYLFSGLIPNTYRVRFTLPAGYSFTVRDAGAFDSEDSDAEPATGMTAPFVVLPSSTTEVDVGAVPPVVGIGDRAWRDLDKDGVQDQGEPPLAGVTVTLYDGTGVAPAVDRTGATVSPATTDANGHYFFDDLIPGSYVVHFSQPTDYSFTTDASPLLTVNSDADLATGFTAAFTVAAVASGTTVADTNSATTAVLANDTIDAGYIAPVVGVGDRAWQDLNQDGLQTVFEPPLADVTVELFNADGTVARDTFGVEVAPTTTDATGFYFFDNLEPGSYRVQFTLPTGYTFTATTPSDDFLLDSDAHPVTGRTAAFSVSDSANPANGTVADTTLGNALFVNPSVDVGAVPPVVGIGDRVWVDSDRDGIQDLAEPGLPGIQVELLDTNDQPAYDTDLLVVLPQITVEGGYYFFDNLVPGNYRIRFTLPDGYVPTLANQGLLEGRDSDADTTTHLTAAFTVEAYSTGHTVTDVDGDTEAQLANLSIDAGFVPIVGVGDIVWLDSDHDGVQDPAETGVAGVEVELFNAADDTPAEDYNGVVLPAATTDGTGYYSFGSLAPGDYYAVFTLPAGSGMRFTAQNVGSSETKDSDVDRLTGRSDDFTISAVASGATVAETDGTTDEAFINPSIDAGAVLVTSIGDVVWLDVDADGIIDGTEGALPGITVELLSPAGASVLDALGNTVAPTTTNGSGTYLFDNILPGEYRVRFTAPDGHVFSPRDAEDDDTVDSDADPATGTTDVFRVHASETGNTEPNFGGGQVALFVDPTVDAGLVPIVAVSNYVWFDDGDGERELGETPAPGVQVEVLRPNGSVANGADGDPVDPVSTGVDGSFFVDGLLPGSYRLRFSAPSGYSFTLRQAVGVDIDKDSDVGADGVTDVFVIAGEAAAPTEAHSDVAHDALFVNPTVGAGFIRVVAVGDYSWIDDNDNGVQDAGEDPLVGMRVQLLDAGGRQARNAQGDLVGVVFTDATGRYVFDNLLPGTYRVHFTPPMYYAFSAPNVGSDTADSDADVGTGLTAPFEVHGSVAGNTVVDLDPDTVAGFVNPSVDAGVLPGRLPDTGNSTWAMVSLSAFVLALGALLAAAARRRRRLA